MVQSTWLKREFIFQREGEFKREEFLKEQLERGFKRAVRADSREQLENFSRERRISEREEKCVLGI